MGAEWAPENHEDLPEPDEKTSVGSCGSHGQALGLGNIPENPSGRAERVVLPQARSSRGIFLCSAANGSKGVRLAAGAAVPALHPPDAWDIGSEVNQRHHTRVGIAAQSSTTTASTCS